LKLLVSALEPSANLHLKEILKRDVQKDISISGIFDKSLGEPIYPSSQFSVMGIFSVIPKILLAKKALKKMVEMAEKSHKILLIDAPAFNIPLAKAIKERYPKKEIIYYILPKVWAWKEGRKELINRYIDTQISIFPFENEYFPNSLYFGNPLYEEIKEFRDEVLNSGAVAFLPGSRKNEIKNLMPIFRSIVEKIEEEAILVIPTYIENISIYGDISQFTISHSTEDTLLKSKFAYICSGTATLEASLIGVPFALLYKTNPIEYFIAKKFVKIGYIGLANIIFDKLSIGEEFHSEYIQKFDIDRLIEEMRTIDKENFLRKSKKLRDLLKGDINNRIVEILIS